MAESKSLLPEKMKLPQSAKFISAIRNASGRKLPQAIAHRGYKAAYPENTMGAFKGAVEMGAHIETDVHLSKDGVVVLSHDGDLKRCFGENRKVNECDWSYLKTLRTLRAPHEAMPRLKDLLEFLTTPGLEDIWVLLDIKMDDDSDDMMRLIGKTLADVKPTKPWEERVVLGCWAASYLPLCSKYLSGYPIMHIGWSIPYARKFLKIPNVSFNLHYMAIAGLGGSSFLRDAKAAKREVILWTVDEVSWMKWSIGKGVDGVITDDPRTFLEVCKNFPDEKPRLSWNMLANLFYMTMMGYVFRLMYRAKVRKLGLSVDMAKIKASMEANL